MCGIAGLLGVESSLQADEAALWDSAARMRHRGPDGQAVWREPGLGLAHTRLAIIDVAGGDQPMFSPDERHVVVFNGEIYNHHEIRRQAESKGYRFRTRCDTEVLLALYELEGPAMVERLRGMFAFCVVDRLERRALLARDRFGKKPLYLAETAGGLAFASTLDALVPLLGAGSPGPSGPSRPEVDAAALAQYLVLQYVPSPLSPYRGVRKVAPGQAAEWRDGSLQVRTYWSPPERTAGASADRREAVLAVREAVGESVRIRLESEVPLGVFLSGGLDSSVVVAEMAASGTPPATYSVGFTHASFDETRYARMVAERFGTEHHELVADEDVPSLFRALTTSYDEPFADSSALATLAVARAAAEHVTVILTGDGGDEMFGGYTRYALYRKAARLHRSLGPLAGAAGLSARAAGAVFRSGRIAGGGAWVHRPWPGYRNALFHFHPSELVGLLRPEALEQVAPDAPVARLDGLWGRAPDRASTLLWVDEQTYLPDDLLTKMDRATMASSLESRSPFLDHVLAERCAGLPESLLFDERGGKAILRAAYQDVLPPEILTRAKMGFGVPLSAWMRNELRLSVDELLLSGAGPLWTWLRRDAVEPLVRRFLDGDENGRWKVWNLLALAGWVAERGL